VCVVDLVFLVIFSSLCVDARFFVLLID